MAFEIVPVTTVEQCEQCRSLACDVWGTAVACSVPQMIVHARYGGVVLLAMQDDVPIGFLFSFPALYQGEFVLWSHETGVVKEYLHQGIGYQLKQEQRRMARELGYKNIGWTFDPLVSRNAYFNLEKLGAHVVEYKINVYGQDESDAINQGLETDRFVALWPVNEQQWQATVRGKQQPQAESTSYKHGVVRTETPKEFGELAAKQPTVAQEWRKRFREQAVELFAQGYRPIRFEAFPDGGCYTWSRER